MALTLEQAWLAWDVLAEECGAKDEIREDFVRYVTDQRMSVSRPGDSDFYEFRFQGDLGLGGKFKNIGGKWYVTCYPEDRTDERQEAVRKATDRLEALRLRTT